jgi:hypothetical protein
MTDYYVIDTRTQKIVNCVSSTREPDISDWPGAEHIRLSTYPTDSQLADYQYYTERL